MSGSLSPSYTDDWATHKDDLQIWRRFWALWELRRKWKWADWFYQRLDRVDGDIVEPKTWSLSPGEGYMKLCLWASFLRSVQEGLTEGLDDYRKDKVSIDRVLGTVPDHLKSFPSNLVKAFKDFRNAIFHCQWYPHSSKLDLDAETTNQLSKLHNDLGSWLDSEFKLAHSDFSAKYHPPDYWIFDQNGNEWMPETFY